MHSHHESLPGYDKAQILHDGCEECERRAASPNLGLAYLDMHSFVSAMHRSVKWNQGQLAYSTVSAAESPLLNVLWAFQCQLENFGYRIGDLP